MTMPATTQVPPPTSGGDPARQRAMPRILADLNYFSLFALLWGYQMLEEKADIFDIHHKTQAPAVLAAVVVLFVPNSVVAFLSLCVLQVINCFDDMPRVVNHAIAIALINIGFLYHFGRAILRARGIAGIDRIAVMEQVSPLIRVATIAVYLYAAFHKLNWGYFDPHHSAFVDTYQRISATLPIFPPLTWSLRWIGMIGSVAAEFGIPILLIFGRTRLLGLILGLIFHMPLGLRHPSFSTLVFALYIVFIPRPMLAAFKAKLASTRMGRLPWLWVPILAVGSAYVLWTITPTYLSGEQLIKDFRHISWFVLFMLLLAVAAVVVVPVLRRSGAKDMALPLRFRLTPFCKLLAIVLFFNGLCPYLGIKTTTSFSMYSNLRTEGGFSNHWIIPKNAIQIVHYQDDLVEVTQSNYPQLQELADERWRIPFIDLQEILAAAKDWGDHDIAVTFRRAGKIYSYSAAEREPDLAVWKPWFVQKFTDYRKVPPAGENRPQW